MCAQRQSITARAGKASKLGNLCSKISKYHYPDRLHKALLINCPGMINQVWGLAKNMLDENARQRTHLYTKKDTKKARFSAHCMSNPSTFVNVVHTFCLRFAALCGRCTQASSTALMHSVCLLLLHKCLW